MNKASRIAAGFLVLGMAVSACGDDGGAVGTTSGDPLNSTEANAVFNQLFGIGFGGLASPPALMAAPAAEPIPETTTQCPGGGSVTVSGDVSGGTTSGSFDITETISGCVVTEGGVAFTVNGDPEIRITGDITIGQTLEDIDIDMTIRGGFTYSSDDGRSGSCGVDVSISMTGSTISASGNVCGQSVVVEVVVA